MLRISSNPQSLAPDPYLMVAAPDREFLFYMQGAVGISGGAGEHVFLDAERLFIPGRA